MNRTRATLPVVLLLTMVVPSFAWDEKLEEETTPKALKQLKAANKELARLNLPPAQPPGQSILIAPDEMAINITNLYSDDALRYFAARVVLINNTVEEMEIDRDQMTLLVDGKPHPVIEVPDKIKPYSFQVGNQGYPLSKLNVAKTVKLPPQGFAETWIFSDALDINQSIPSLKLEVQTESQKLTFDFTSFSRGQLRMSKELIGPQKCLALITISGPLNSLNLKLLLDELDQLIANQVFRAVIHWPKDAAPPDNTVYQYLAQAAGAAGFREVNNRQFPEIPLSMRELHLASVPGGLSSYSYYNGPRRTHDTVEQAVTAALYSAYEVLPPSAILQEIQQGHELSRIAALTTASGRLPRNQLALIVKFAHSDDPRIQRAALTGLRDFGDPLALKTLVEFAKHADKEVAQAAIASLASSRFGTAHDALLEMLKTAEPSLKRTIVMVLAKYPRPIWSEPIYEFAQNLDTPIGREALKALVEIGHPQLNQLLVKALHHKDQNLQNEILGLLISRNDPASEKIALEYVMQKMQDQPPTSPMLGLIRRAKYQAAVPLLLKHFDQLENNRGEIINTLAAIGDQSVARVLVDAYPKVRNYEQPTILSALMRLKAPEFRELARQALYSENSTLVNIACQGFRQDNNPETLEWLAEALEKTKSTWAWSEIANAIASIATAEAREILRQAAIHGDEQKRNSIRGALQNLYQRSPGNRYVYQAKDHVNHDRLEEALEFYDMALKVDPLLPQALEGRGHVYLKLEKADEALRDYTRAGELDPFSSLPATGVALAKIMKGDVLEAIEIAEKPRKQFEGEPIYAYNLACVYSRALEKVRNQEDFPERDKRLQAYLELALKELARSRELGFNQLDLLRKDPDLDPLRDEPEFKNLSSENYKPKERKQPNL